MDTSRRKLLQAALLGAGGLGVRGLLASLPLGLLGAPRRSEAQAVAACNATALPGTTRPQRIILITSAAGDPLNANVPGCYEEPRIYHPSDVDLPAGTISYPGGRTCRSPWAALDAVDPRILDRTCFFHHATYSNAHGDHAKVNALMGAIRRQELLVSLLAKNIATCTASPTTQAEPVVLSNVLIRYSGAVLPVLGRSALADVLGVPASGSTAATLRGMRDRDQGRLAALLRASATPAQRLALDRYEAAQAQARAVPAALVSAFDDPADDTEQKAVNTAAVVLLAMNVSPVVVMSYDFGGDNHTDGNLATEARETRASIAAIGDLWTKLGQHALQDDVTIILQNVFGRTLDAANRGGNTNGRDHNSAHHCSVLIGRGFARSVIGGVTPVGNDFGAQAIDSATGAADRNGDVTYEESLASLGKTIGVAVGVSPAALTEQFMPGRGKVVPAALA
jgi:hypothetical protein